MQDSETDTKSNSNEDLIHFRPSPNFKHMKKYLKFKFEESLNQTNKKNLSMSNADDQIPEAASPQEEKKVRALVQPPLPPNPPPPDSPPLITPKLEKEADSYKCETECSSEEGNECKVIKPEVIMCRNYIRGTCKKGAACKFTHEQIVSQLPGVYTFCKNFQNSVCARPKCKFVHATVFEKEHFLRTGFLPPHVFDHLKEPSAPQPPLPPTEGQVKVDPVYTKPPPPPPSQVYVAPLPSLTYPETGTDSIQPTLTGNTSPKRKWSDTDESCCSSCDIDESVPLAKKCKYCGSNEFRYLYVKNRLEKEKTLTDQLNQKINEISQKHQKVSKLLMSLFKPIKSSSTNNILKRLEINGKKDEDILDESDFLLDGATLLSQLTKDNNKDILEETDFLLGGNNLLSQFTKDNNKNLLLDNMSVSDLLTTMLLYSEEPSITADEL